MTRLYVPLLWFIALWSIVACGGTPTTPAKKTRHVVLSRKAHKKTYRSPKNIGTLLTFYRPTTERVANWFQNVKERALEFNHDSVGMTNPCLHISLTQQQQVQEVSNKPCSSSVKEDFKDAWFPLPGSNSDSSTRPWRVLRYRRRVGVGEVCYSKVRDAALDWEFSSTDNMNEKGILRVCHEENTAAPRLQRHDSRGVGYEVVHNAVTDDGDFTLSKECGQHVMEIWSGPNEHGRRIVTYSAANLGGTPKEEEKVRFRWPRLYAVNPMMVVYDLVDQRGPCTTYTSTAAATLKGHLLSGEERVTVALRDDCVSQDGSTLNRFVDVEILSYSKPAPSFLGKLVWPLIGPMQDRFFESQMDALERIGKQSTTKPTRVNTVVAPRTKR